MKKKYTMVIMFMFIFVISVFIPKDVFAVDDVGKIVRFETTIEHWSNSYSLSYSCNSNDGIVPRVYFKDEDDEITEASCNFDFDDFNFPSDSTVTLVEAYDFTNYGVIGLEYETVEISPGVISLGGTSIAVVDNYVFDLYDYDSKDVTLYKVNELDAYDFPTGSSEVLTAFFDGGNGEKSVSTSLGTVRMPKFCVNYHFAVKGNISDPTGSFTINRDDEEWLTGTGNSTVSACEIDNNPMQISDFSDLMNEDLLDVVYEGVSRASDYEFSFLAGELDRNDNIFSRTLDITARLETDGSQTGIIYSIIPFIILFGLLGIGVIVIRNNHVKES